LNNPTQRSPKKIAAYIALVVGIIVLGFSAIFVHLAGTSGSVAAFYRFMVAAVLVFIPYLINVQKKKTPTPALGLRLAIIGGILFGLDVLFWATGIVMSGVTNPTLLANTAPLWVGLGSVIILKEQQPRLFWVGLFIALLGAAIVLGVDLSQGSNLGLGTFFGLLAAIFYGAYFLVTQRGREHLDTLSYFWITTFVSGLFLFAVNILFKQPLTGYPITTYLYFLALGVIVQAVGWFLLNFTQGYLPASIVSPSMLGQPIVTAFIALFLLGETFTIQQIFGGLAVLVGILIVHRSQAIR